MKANSSALLVAPSCDSFANDPLETRRAFLHFRDVSGPALVNFGSHYFWNTLVLQVSHQDESIKHLVIASSALDRYQRSAIGTQLDLLVYRRHYGIALQTLSSRPNPDAGIILMACLLFIVCDEFQANRSAALQHIMAGRDIMVDYCKSHDRARYSTTIEELGPIFQRLQTNTGELEQQSMPYQLQYECDSQPPAYPSKPFFSCQLWPGSPGHIDILDAGQSLQTLAQTCMEPQPGIRPPYSQFHVVSDITAQLNEWLTSFKITCSNPAASFGVTQRTQMHLLLMYHSCLRIMSRCAPFDEETLYDQYWGQLEHVMVKMAYLVRDTHNFAFSSLRLEETLLPAFFFIALHYRSCEHRRRAINSLQECGWEGNRLARIAEQVVELEEGGYEDAVVAADIPESNRMRVVDILFPTSRSSEEYSLSPDCTLVYHVYPYNRPSSLRHHDFQWDGMTDKAVQESVRRLLKRASNFEFVCTNFRDIQS